MPALPLPEALVDLAQTDEAVVDHGDRASRTSRTIDRTEPIGQFSWVMIAW